MGKENCQSVRKMWENEKRGRRGKGLSKSLKSESRGDPKRVWEERGRDLRGKGENWEPAWHFPLRADRAWRSTNRAVLTGVRWSILLFHRWALGTQHHGPQQYWPGWKKREREKWNSRKEKKHTSLCAAHCASAFSHTLGIFCMFSADWQIYVCIRGGELCRPDNWMWLRFIC